MEGPAWQVSALVAALASLALLSGAGAAQPEQCTAASTERKVALLELYTSEGCSSCPPADRWVSELPRRGLAADRLVILGFHVDYWDYIGWPDPYAQRRFSERQRYVNTRNGARFVYTPQLMLDGKDYRRGFWRDDIAATVQQANRQPAGAKLQLTVVPAAGVVEVRTAVELADSATRSTADLYLALLEDGLENRVTAGENRGRHLKHDFVVRELAGPFSPQATPGVEHRFSLDQRWKMADLSVAAFVQRRDTGEVLQALAVVDCLKK